MKTIRVLNPNYTFATRVISSAIPLLSDRTSGVREGRCVSGCRCKVDEWNGSGSVELWASSSFFVDAGGLDNSTPLQRSHSRFEPFLLTAVLFLEVPPNTAVAGALLSDVIAHEFADYLLPFCVIPTFPTTISCFRDLF